MERIETYLLSERPEAVAFQAATGKHRPRVIGWKVRAVRELLKVLDDSDAIDSGLLVGVPPADRATESIRLRCRIQLRTVADVARSDPSGLVATARRALLRGRTTRDVKRERHECLSRSHASLQ